MDDRGTNNTPWIERESTWKAIVFGLAGAYAVGLLLGLVALIWTSHDDFNKGTETYWRLAIIGGAVVTFATVMWRGMIATRQTDQQQRQVEQTDENNLAALLQEGAKLIADKEQVSRVAAGIATLQTVATAQNRRFAIPAMDLLAGYIEADSAMGHASPNVRAAIAALAIAHETTGLESGRSIACVAGPGIEAPEDGIHVKPDPWRPIRGAQRVRYGGGSVIGWLFGGIATSYRFTECRIDGAELDLTRFGQFWSCRFVRCDIQAVPIHELRDHYFDGCDFSGAELRGDKLPDVSKMHGQNNYYHHGDPPMLVNDDEPTRVITDWPFLEERFDDPFLGDGPIKPF